MLSALTIRGRDDIKTMATGPDDDGKYAGWIMYGERFEPLVSTRPIYDSEEQATQAMQDIIDEVRGMELEDPFNVADRAAE